jgi:ankyrin repeat protein
MFTNDDKARFLKCDTVEKLDEFLDSISINGFDEYGNTILHYYLKNPDAVPLDRKLVVTRLLQKGININAQSTAGKFRHTPLNLSLNNGLKDIFDLLLHFGADVNVPTANGNPVLFNVMMKPQLDQAFFIQRLLKYGADIHQKNDHGVSPADLSDSISNSDLKKYFTKD